MLNFKNINELLDLLKKIEYPIAIMLAIVLIVFLIFRKFTTTEYITAGKTAFESLNKVCDQLQEENKNLKVEFKMINERLELSQKTIKELRERLSLKKSDKNKQANS